MVLHKNKIHHSVIHLFDEYDRTIGKILKTSLYNHEFAEYFAAHPHMIPTVVTLKRHTEKAVLHLKKVRDRMDSGIIFKSDFFLSGEDDSNFDHLKEQYLKHGKGRIKFTRKSIGIDLLHSVAPAGHPILNEPKSDHLYYDEQIVEKFLDNEEIVENPPPACIDNHTYRNEINTMPCGYWSGGLGTQVNCQNWVTDRGGTDAEQKRLLDSCPKSCGLCPEPTLCRAAPCTKDQMCVSNALLKDYDGKEIDHYQCIPITRCDPMHNSEITAQGAYEKGMFSKSVECENRTQDSNFIATNYCIYNNAWEPIIEQENKCTGANPRTKKCTVVDRECTTTGQCNKNYPAIGLPSDFYKCEGGFCKNTQKGKCISNPAVQQNTMWTTSGFAQNSINMPKSTAAYNDFSAIGDPTHSNGPTMTPCTDAGFGGEGNIWGPSGGGGSGVSYQTEYPFNEDPVCRNNVLRAQFYFTLSDNCEWMKENKSVLMAMQDKKIEKNMTVLEITGIVVTSMLGVGGLILGAKLAFAKKSVDITQEMSSIVSDGRLKYTFKPNKNYKINAKSFATGHKNMMDKKAKKKLERNAMKDILKNLGMPGENPDSVMQNCAKEIGEAESAEAAGEEAEGDDVAEAIVDALAGDATAGLADFAEAEIATAASAAAAEIAADEKLIKKLKLVTNELENVYSKYEQATKDYNNAVNTFKELQKTFKVFTTALEAGSSIGTGAVLGTAASIALSIVTGIFTIISVSNTTSITSHMMILSLWATFVNGKGMADQNIIPWGWVDRGTGLVYDNVAWGSGWSDGSEYNTVKSRPYTLFLSQLDDKAKIETTNSVTTYTGFEMEPFNADVTNKINNRGACDYIVRTTNAATKYHGRRVRLLDPSELPTDTQSGFLCKSPKTTANPGKANADQICQAKFAFTHPRTEAQCESYTDGPGSGAQNCVYQASSTILGRQCDIHNKHSDCYHSKFWDEGSEYRNQNFFYCEENSSICQPRNVYIDSFPASVEGSAIEKTTCCLPSDPVCWPYTTSERLTDYRDKRMWGDPDEMCIDSETGKPWVPIDLKNPSTPKCQQWDETGSDCLSDSDCTTRLKKDPTYKYLGCDLTNKKCTSYTCKNPGKCKGGGKKDHACTHHSDCNTVVPSHNTTILYPYEKSGYDKDKSLAIWNTTPVALKGKYYGRFGDAFNCSYGTEYENPYNFKPRIANSWYSESQCEPCKLTHDEICPGDAKKYWNSKVDKCGPWTSTSSCTDERASNNQVAIKLCGHQRGWEENLGLGCTKGSCPTIKDPGYSVASIPFKKWSDLSAYLLKSQKACNTPGKPSAGCNLSLYGALRNCDTSSQQNFEKCKNIQIMKEDWGKKGDSQGGGDCDGKLGTSDGTKNLCVLLGAPGTSNTNYPKDFKCKDEK